MDTPSTFAGPDISTLLRSRRSIRAFSGREVAPALLQAILDDARWAPSWSNTQPYLLAAATGPLKDQLKQALLAKYDAGNRLAHAPAWRKAWAAMTRNGLPDGDFNALLDYPAALQPRRQATGFGLYRLLGIAREDKAARDLQMRRNFEFFGAPVVIFLFVHEKLGAYSVLDAGMVLQSLMLSAHARGLGSCAQGALAIWASPVRAAFDVPPGYKMLCGVSVGWPDDHPVNHYNPGRADLAELMIKPR